MCMAKPIHTQFPLAPTSHTTGPLTGSLPVTCCGIWPNLGVSSPEEISFLFPYRRNLTFVGTWDPQLEPVPEKQQRLGHEIDNSWTSPALPTSFLAPSTFTFHSTNSFWVPRCQANTVLLLLLERQPDLTLRLWLELS